MPSSIWRFLIEFLELAEDDTTFRESFFNTIQDTSANCGDRAALSIVHLGIAKKWTHLDKKSIQNVLTHLRLVFVVDQLEKIARDKIDTLSCCDPIEVYLDYLVKLQERLQIDLSQLLIETTSILKIP